jgi:hypothetical protein
VSKVYKILGQEAPIAFTETNLYEVPANKQSVTSSLVVCNRNITGAIGSYSLAVVPNGETLANKHYLIYDKPINFRDTNTHVLGMSLQVGDSVIVIASTADLSFTLFGVEMG